jgi:uncharacterized protein YcaQ
MSVAAPSMMSAREARALAVAAAERASRGSVRAVLDHLGVVQLDTISALARAHQLTLATRARVTVEEVDRQLWSGAAPLAFETWAHAASLVPMRDWPAWGFRMRRVRGVWGAAPPDEGFARRIVDRVAAEGPIALQKLRADGEPGGGWEWGPTRMAVEWLIRSGRLVCAQRQGFRRIVDLPERVVPAELLAVELSDDACLDRLVTTAMRVLGVGTVRDVADYLRLPQAEARAVLERSDLARADVEGWSDGAWLSDDHAALTGRRPATRGRFVGPFDNLIWYRPRVKRIFGFEHTLEAYLPAVKREHGYYVCPLLAGTELVGRADLAAGRGVLRILRLSFTRDGARAQRALVAAVTELTGLLGSERVVLGPDAAQAAGVLADAAAEGLLPADVGVVA